MMCLICIYIYIYIERERDIYIERERCYGSFGLMVLLVNNNINMNSIDYSKYLHIICYSLYTTVYDIYYSKSLNYILW